MICELYLPFPPTVNNYYMKSKAGGRYISEKGRRFRDEVAKCISEQCPGLFIEDRVLVQIVLFPPDKRRRDVDNYNKSLLDAISEAGLWEDDVIVDQLFNYRGAIRSRNGSVYVRITDAGPVISSEAMLPVD